MTWWEVILTFFCGASCAVIMGMIGIWLWLHKAFSSFW